MLLQHGFKIVDPTKAEIAATRKHLMSTQAGLVKEMKIDADAVDLAMQELRAAKVEF